MAQGRARAGMMTLLEPIDLMTLGAVLGFVAALITANR